VVGVIGRNGAGKSTLLKILSRITKPTKGHAEIHGRVGSLLEVGTGFHPELTGRENIYLNGAILGMKRAEIDRKFDEIVAFAEVEKFIDTPVKRYSSGMYVRLAFAVAAHLEPEILMVDEVLAVGDAAFQKKCLGKMGDVAKEGRTVLFVSHNMAAVAGLCERALLLDEGAICFTGGPNKVIQKYLELCSTQSETVFKGTRDRLGSGAIRFTGFYCEEPAGAIITHLTSGQPINFIMTYENRDRKPLKNVSVAIAVYDSLGYKLTNLSNHYFDNDSFDVIPQVGEFVCQVPRLPLRTGQYYLELYGEVNGIPADWLRDVTGFEVSDGDFFGTGRLTNPGQGVFFVDHSWSVRSSKHGELTSDELLGTISSQVQHPFNKRSDHV
jgi:lipopolysaccharide transport system ATP-binding protein